MDTDTEKRLLLAFLLSFGFLIVWRVFFMPPAPPAPKPAASRHSASPKSGAKPKPTAKPPAAVKLPVVQGQSSRDIVIQSQFYRVTLSTRGGVVTNWILRKYRDENGKLLDMVNASACAALGYPLSLELADQALSEKVNSAVFVATPSADFFQAPQTVTLTYSDGKTEIRKEISFGPAYEVKVSVSAFNGRRYLPVSIKWPGGAGDQSLPQAEKEEFSLAFYDTGGGIKTVAEKKADSETIIPGPVEFAGLEDHFFASAFLPGSDHEAFRYLRQLWSPPGWSGKEPPKALTAILGNTERSPLRFSLLVAPKDMEVLRAVNPQLSGLVNFGWFSFFAKPLFLAMRWINVHFTHNWGWAIVVLTVLINTVFFPLKIKSIRSAQSMQKIAPMVKEIQNRYKQYKFNDPRKQRMNQEIMKLYQEHGVNPLGGCLPMVAQLPIIYAFYEVLESSIAMRHAPWIWWIKDLSVPDHLYILPSIMIVASFVMQKMTPMPTADPAQQRMMMLAPLFVGIIFFKLAAGVVLYYFTYNLVAIAQQVVINRMVPPPAPVTPPAARSQGGSARKPAAVKG